MEAPTPGQLLRDGVTQAQLAIRASTTQSAISRIERDQVSPTVATLRELLHLLGEDLVLSSEARDSGVDRTQAVERLRLEPAKRVEHGLAWADQVIASSPEWRRRKVA